MAVSVMVMSDGSLMRFEDSDDEVLDLVCTDENISHIMNEITQGKVLRGALKG